MPAPRRVAIDPNVLVSAAITPSGSTAAITDLIDAGIIVPVVSTKLLAELDGVLRREKFRQHLSLREAEAYVSDREDDYLIALARAAEADALVSGDTDLTGLDLPCLPVLTPSQLLESHAANGDPGTPST